MSVDGVQARLWRCARSEGGHFRGRFLQVDRGGNWELDLREPRTSPEGERMYEVV